MYISHNLFLLLRLRRKSSDTEFIISNNITLDPNQLTFQLLLTVSAPATQISFYTTVIHIQQNLLLLLRLGCRDLDTGFMTSSHICLDIYHLTFQLLPTVSAPATKMSFYTTIMYI